MATTVSRVKTWAATEDVTAADLNAEFDNLLNNLDVSTLDDYSVSVAEMQTQTDPGEVGTESQATTLAGELERLRWQLKSITGKTYWYESPSQTIESLASASGGGTPGNTVQSGKTRSGSSQLVALVPAGTGNGRTVTLEGSATNFVYTINNTQYTISTDVTSAALTAAPSSNNTALVDDAAADDSASTKYFGEYGSSLIIDTAGTEITSRVGQLAGFKINNGSADEYFIARIKSTTELTEVRRGFFFDSSDNPVSRIAIADDDTITFLNLAYIFADTGGALDVTNTEPIISSDTPSSPALGQYWFDMINNLWKTYNGSSFVNADSTLIGYALTDTTDTVAARTLDQFKFGSSKNTVKLEVFDNTQVRAINRDAEVDIFGSEARYGDYLPRWDMDDDLDTGITESASTTYYLYLDENGDEIISDVAPMDRRADYQSLYHPYQTWRCVGQVYNNASSNLEAPISYSDASEFNHMVTSEVNASALTVKIHRDPTNLVRLGNDTSVKNVAVLPGNSLTVSSGSTLGTSSGGEETIHVLGAVYSNRLEPVISRGYADPGDIISTVAEGGGGGADNDHIYYSLVARTSVPAYPFAKFHNSQTTAGTWAAVLDELNLFPFTLNGRVNLQEFTGSGTWTKPANLYQAIVITTGGGGGGGGADSNGATEGAGGGGGAGGTCIEVFDPRELGATETVTIGGGGAGGSTAGGNGGVGGNSTFGSHHTAGGGGAGNGGASTTALGGVKGTASGGDLNISGSAGQAGVASLDALCAGGTGGSSIWGGAGRGAVKSSGGNAVGVKGSGGGGGSDTTTSGDAGAAGGAGYCLVIEILKG